LASVAGAYGEKKKPEASLSTEPEWQESAGSLLLLAAATETGLLAQFSQALRKDVIQPRSSRLSDGLSTGDRLLLTLLFLGAVELRRTWDLRGYTGDGLALLTARKRAYGYRYTEEFLVRIAQAGGAECLTDTLARWTAHLWKIQDTSKDAFPSAFYVDGHRKPVYSDVLIPRGLVGRLSAVLGSRTLVLLHDATSDMPYLPPPIEETCISRADCLASSNGTSRRLVPCILNGSSWIVKGWQRNSWRHSRLRDEPLSHSCVATSTVT